MAGADLIIGHHLHVVQDMQLVQGVPVFYSLGKFIFDQYFSPDVLEGLLLSLQVTKDAYTVSLHPHSSTERQSQPRLLHGLDKTTFLTQLAQRSAPELEPAIVSGVLTGHLRE